MPLLFNLSTRHSFLFPSRSSPPLVSLFRARASELPRSNPSLAEEGRSQSPEARRYGWAAAMEGSVGPRVYSCSNCGNHVCLHDDIISKAFHGRHGRAFLFSHGRNIVMGPKQDRLLMTGIHTVADVYCHGCGAVLGWKYERAYEETQRLVDFPERVDAALRTSHGHKASLTQLQIQPLPSNLVCWMCSFLDADGEERNQLTQKSNYNALTKSQSLVDLY
ncbi:hypothetical protein MUK42_26762 [Musa troglodytarum]|uniref:Yippee domain-containing protein n=1 Tax=Musa troglodytarum TaxID=320322 RepID=A0A9E7JMY6_9LILI|nr:hypothetical protein MUK42_26762 [Musa troglodytarum]